MTQPQPQLALITGGNRGIGIEIVRQLSEKGVRTLFTSRNPHDGLQALDKLSGLRDFLDYHPLDVSEPESVAALHRYVLKKYDRLDILINNAAVNYDVWQRVGKVSMSEVEYTFKVNFLGPWRMCNSFIPLLKKGLGRIINISSGAGTFAHLDGSTPGYSLSKNGLNMLTKSLAADLQGTGITVNAVCPGWVRTDMGGSKAPRSPSKGAETTVWLATQEKEIHTGKFFRDKKEISW